jgi:hypothetical protein
VGAAQWASAAPGSHGAIAWHLRLHGGTPVIKSGHTRETEEPWTFIHGCRLAFNSPARLPGCMHTWLHLKHTFPPLGAVQVPSPC